jgi:hypothetical protein
MGILEIKVDVRTSDVMAGAGDQRPTSDTSQQVPCYTSVGFRGIYHVLTIDITRDSRW